MCCVPILLISPLKARKKTLCQLDPITYLNEYVLNCCSKPMITEKAL